jgi:cytochrome oxidase assembly protein ShyY1
VTQPSPGPDLSAGPAGPDEAAAPQGARQPDAARLAHDVSRDAKAEPRTLRQWVTLALGVLLVAALCVLAGRWQWHRYESRSAQIEIIESNYDAEPVPLSDVLDGPGAVLDPQDVWQRVTLEGTYVEDAMVLLRNRPAGGKAGFHVLVPFVTTPTDGGEKVVMVVDRGFVPLGADASAPDAVPAPPAGTVEVTVSLRADEPASRRDAPAGQVQAINTAQVLAEGPDGAAWAEGATVGAYGSLRAEDPAPSASLRPLPVPDTDPGSHLSYTFQWFVFAAGAIGGFLILIRREKRETVTAGDLLGEQRASGRAPGETSPRRKRGPTAEEEEDALIDAQLPEPRP